MRGPFALSLRLRLHRALRVRRVIEQVHVQVAVSVVVEEQRLRGIADVIEPVLFRSVGERPVPVVDVEHVAPVHREVVDAGDVDVQPAVAIDVRHRDAGLPAVRVGDARFLGDVLELIVALIAIELVRAEVRSEVEIREPVPVDVAGGDATAVVVVEVVQGVEVGPFRKRVGERNARCLRLQQLEQRGRRGRGWLAGGERNHPSHCGSLNNELRIRCCPLPADRYPLVAARSGDRSTARLGTSNCFSTNATGNGPDVGSEQRVAISGQRAAA